MSAAILGLPAVRVFNSRSAARLAVISTGSTRVFSWPRKALRLFSIPNSRSLAEGVQLVWASMIQIHHLAPVFVFLGRTALLFHRGGSGVTRPDEILAGLAGDRRNNARGHVRDGGQDCRHHPGTEFFVFAAGGNESVLYIIDRRIGELLGAVTHTVMIGLDQALGGCKGGGTNVGQLPGRGAD